MLNFGQKLLFSIQIVIDCRAYEVQIQHFQFENAIPDSSWGSLLI